MKPPSGNFLREFHPDYPEREHVHSGSALERRKVKQMRAYFILDAERAGLDARSGNPNPVM
jgi:hypothetical protein